MAESSGRRRSKAIDDTDIFPPVVDDNEEPVEGEDYSELAQSDAADRMIQIRSRANRFGQAVVDRLAQLSVVIVAGIAMCLSFPPFGWWFMAFLAFGLLAWVLTRETTTRAGGFGYGFLFGLVFYLPLLPWVGGFVGAIPWIALCILEALFPAQPNRAGNSASRMHSAIHGAVRRLPMGSGRVRSNGRSVADNRSTRWCAAAVLRRGVGWIQLGGNNFRSDQMVASR